MAAAAAEVEGEGGVLKTSGFKNFNEFFPYYMNEHKNLTCRRLHGRAAVEKTDHRRHGRAADQRPRARTA